VPSPPVVLRRYVSTRYSTGDTPPPNPPLIHVCTATVVKVICLERIVPAAALQRQPPWFRERLYGGFAPVTANAAGFHTAERHVGLVMHRGVIDMDHARFQTLGDVESFSLILSNDPRR